jgi:hypothetical protein
MNDFTRQQSKWWWALHADFPLVGWLRRHWAMHQVNSKFNSAQAIPVLVAAADKKFGPSTLPREVPRWAIALLKCLSSREAMDEICTQAKRTGYDWLEKLVAKEGYECRRIQLAVAALLQEGWYQIALPTADDGQEWAMELVRLLEDPDEEIRTRAREAIENAPPSFVKNAFCTGIGESPSNQAARKLVQGGTEPSERGQICLSVFLTRQFDTYFVQDPEFRGLRSAYQKASPRARAQVMDIICSGELRLWDFFGTCREAPTWAVAILVSLLDNPNRSIRAKATQVIQRSERGAMQDELCRLAMEDPSGPLAQIVVRAGMRPSDQQQACLFLFVTRQLDTYFTEDSDFRKLRAAYDKVSRQVRSRVMDVVRSGDRRCQGFFGARKPLSECTDEEIRIATDSWVRDKDWQRVCKACLELPLRFSLRLFEPLRSSGWTPDDSELRGFLSSILKKAKRVSPANVAEYQRSLDEHVFDLRETRKEPKRKAGELLEAIWHQLGVDAKDYPGVIDSLIASVDSKNPIHLEISRLREELVQNGLSDSPLATALNSRERTENRKIRKLINAYNGLLSSWLYNRRFLRKDMAQTKEFISDTRILTFWPSKATVRELDEIVRLQKVPSQVNPSPYAATWKAVLDLLHTLMGYRLTTPTFEPVVVDVGEFAGEFLPTYDSKSETPDDT